jgi:Ca2+-binding RTX toxin-like protein
MTGSGNDTLDGNEWANDLRGWTGDDEVSGGDGNDVIDGGDGYDTLDGEGGVNTCLNGESVANCDVV